MKKCKFFLMAIIVTLILGLLGTNSYAKADKVKANGIYKVSIGKQPNKALELPGGNTDNNAGIGLWDYGSAAWQKFYFEYEGGFYKITAMHTGKSLTVKNNNITDGTEIVQSDYVGSDGQKWILRDTNKNGWVISLYSNLNLSICVKGSIQNGSKIVLSKTADNDNQMFYLYDISNNERTHNDGIYKMSIGANPNKTLELPGGNTENNTRIGIWEYGNAAWQKFYFEYKEGYYKITSMHTGKSLTAKNNSIAEGTEIIQSDYAGTNGQKWILRDTNKNGWIISPLSNPNLAISIQGKIQNGSKLILSKTRDNDNQMLYLYNISNNEKTHENANYEILVGASSNKGLEVPGGNTENDAKIGIWDYGNAAWQKFKFEYKEGYYKITATHTGKSLTVKGDNLKEGAEIVQSDYTGSNCQKWILKDSNKNGWIISPLNNPELALTIQNSIQNGSKIVLSKAKNNDNQMFYLVKTVEFKKTVDNGTYKLAVGANTNKTIEVSGNNVNNNATLGIWEYGNVSWQKFKFEYVDGFYKITARHTGKSLTVKDNNIVGGAEIVQDDYKGLLGQMWIIVDSKINGWTFSPVSRQDLAITIQNKIENGSKIVLGDKQKASSTQLFYLYKTTVSGVNIDSVKYPGIMDSLDSLAEKYSNWQFEILYTNLDFSTTVRGEYEYANKQGNLVYTPTYNGDWIAPNPYISGVWASASYKGIAYFMDPRNFLNDTDIFQFLDLGNYESSGATLSSIKYQVDDTFLQNNASDIMSACKNKNINPYYVIARLFQEQGRNGSGTINMDGGDGKKYYNPFNIGAQVGNDIPTALAYAKSKGWDTMTKGLEGGITILKSNYIDIKQHTLYLNKFDVNPASGGGLYNHQYMQNLSAAYSEARTLRSAYANTGTLKNSIKFVIPVYENMPLTNSIKPESNGGNQQVTGEKVTVRTESKTGIRLRKEPGTNSEIVASISDGTIGIRIKKHVKNIDGYWWDEVDFGNGLKGYAATDYLK